VESDRSGLTAHGLEPAAADGGDTVRRKRILLFLAGTASVAVAILYVLRAGLSERIAGRRRVSVSGPDEHLPTVWSFDRRVSSVRAGTRLRIQTPSPAVIHWSTDQWDTVRDTPLARLRSGVYFFDLPTDKLEPGTRVLFTFYWPEAKRWEGQDFQLTVQPSEATTAPA
jgi:hypothetical protein